MFGDNTVAWVPGGIAPQLWLDAADDATLTLNSTSVSQWADKSGFNRHATQANAANQPSANPNALNGRRVLGFDGSNDFFSVNLDFLAGQSHSAFIVTKPTAFSNIYGAASANAGSRSLHVGFTNSNNYRVNFWANHYQPPITGNFVAGAASLLNDIWNPGSGKQILANGKTEGSSTTAGNIGTMAGGGRIVHTTAAPHSAFGGQIAAIVIFTG
ncbi:MAG: hypothetical protein MUF04_03730, partial [Akkermansiaceae bacterium]|nr:hypothetical protein [Akkermansiaceae bacterium]